MCYFLFGKYGMFYLCFTFFFFFGLAPDRMEGEVIAFEYEYMRVTD